VLLAGACAGRGEIALSAYGGKAWNLPADLHVRQPGGTDLTLFGVDLHDDSFEGPIYYGLRATYWLPPPAGEARRGRWGLALDFAHAKVIAQETQVVRQEGTRDGAPVNGRFPVSDTLESYELSHGLNLATLNVVRRWLPERGRLAPYAGAGAGAAIPHVEATVGGVRTEEYQLAGWTLQGLAGVSLEIAGPVAAFLEYKLNWADVDAGLDGKGSIRQEIWTHQLLLGMTLRF
jgi:lipid A oxidase